MSRFLHSHGIVLLCVAVVVAAIWWGCHLRFKRLRERERLAREVEDALVQNAQGLILNVHGIVRRLAASDPMRKRVEEALDKADEQLSEDRDRVQDLRARVDDDEASLHQIEADAQTALESEVARHRNSRNQKRRFFRWLTFRHRR